MLTTYVASVPEAMLRITEAKPAWIHIGRYSTTPLQKQAELLGYLHGGGQA